MGELNTTSLTLGDVASFFISKDDRKENACLKKGFLKLKATFIAGDIDFKNGTLKYLLLTMPTAAHVLANNEITLEERAENLKQILDTDNVLIAQGLIIAMDTHRDMANHDIQMV